MPRKLRGVGKGGEGSRKIGGELLGEKDTITNKEVESAAKILQEFDKKIDKRWVKGNLPRELIKDKEKLNEIVLKINELLKFVEEEEKGKLIGIFKEWLKSLKLEEKPLQGQETIFKLKEAGKEVRDMVHRIDFTKVVKEPNGEEYNLFSNGVDFLLEYFPPEERVPFDVFLEAAKQDVEGKIGNNPYNRYHFAVARDKNGKIVGACSSLYFADLYAMFGGYIRVAPEMQGKGIATALYNDRIKFGEKCAKEANRKLRFFISEVEKPEESTNIKDAERRLRVFKSFGMGVLDPSSGFRYGQTTEEGKIVPLYLMIGPINEKISKLEWHEVAKMVIVVYKRIYRWLDKEIFWKGLGEILKSIPLQGVPIKTDYI